MQSVLFPGNGDLAPDADASSVTAAVGAVTDQVVLSLFPGIDILGRGFEEAGFCVVRGPDVLWGGDIRRFRVPRGVFAGVIGGSPCPDFSKARRREAGFEGLELLGHFVRVVRESGCAWWLLENVPCVPDVVIDGYAVQRLDLAANEFGLGQRRIRHFQFGRACDRPGLVVGRRVTAAVTVPASLASAGSHGRRTWAEFCAAQGLEAMELGAMTKAGRYRVVGNAVALPVARAMARAVAGWMAGVTGQVCECGCGRRVTGRRRLAGAACRKRVQRRRDIVTKE